MRGYYTVGKRVEIAREEAGYTQMELAQELRKLGFRVSQSTLAKIENNQQDASLGLAAAIARLTNVTVDFLAVDSDDPQRREEIEEERRALRESQVVFEVEDSQKRMMVRRLMDAFMELSARDQELVVQMAETMRQSARPRIIGDGATESSNSQVTS